MEPTKFIVLSEGRTGSTLLVHLLRSHRRIRMLGEELGEIALGNERTKRRIGRLGPVRYVEQLLKPPLFKKAAGFKLKYYYVSQEYGEQMGVDGLPDVLDFLVSRRDIKIIHLKRLNRLKTLVSTRVARITGVYLDTGKREAPGEARFELMPERCERAFKRMEECETSFDNTFKDHPMLEVHYEALVKERRHECDRILNFLGLPLRPLTTKTRKQRSTPLSETIANYKELSEHFRSTQWAGYFTD